MFETQALYGVVKLDIDSQVVGVQFQLVAGNQPTVFADVHGEGGDPPVNRKLPVFVVVRVRSIINHRNCLLELIQFVFKGMTALVRSSYWLCFGSLKRLN